MCVCVMLLCSEIMELLYVGSDTGSWQFVRRLYLTESLTSSPRYARTMELRYHVCVSVVSVHVGSVCSGWCMHMLYVYCYAVS